ncbi:unnamed protein product [Prorocentrum cordatum]|uniref:Uncharacterized protein n=1 Tax=Prorocentrum cordatum TaxID=2364126 RepID=A0ABN9WNR9_9DINO|nr:unnamed protein product [Polarella glacialis]
MSEAPPRNTVHPYLVQPTLLPESLDVRVLLPITVVSLTQTVQSSLFQIEICPLSQGGHFIPCVEDRIPISVLLLQVVRHEQARDVPLEHPCGSRAGALDAI